MRRAFTIQLYDQPVHAHICPQCEECIPCRLPHCRIVWPGHPDDGDLGLRRECKPCREELQIEPDWCEHCGSDIVTSPQLREDWKDHPPPPSPHHRWCFRGLDGTHHPLCATAPVRAHLSGSTVVITACVDIVAGDRLVQQSTGLVIGMALQPAKAGELVVVRVS